MSEISKGALTSENNSSFPNNNTGYITPTILRTFNQNMIDSLVDEISYTADSASVNTKITQLENFSSSLDATFATDAQLSASVAALSSSVAGTTAQSLVTASISGDVITFTKGNGSTFPISIPIASGSVPTGTVSSSAQIAAFGYATTGSNRFVGDQIVTGSVTATSNVAVSAGAYSNVGVTADITTDPSNVFASVGVGVNDGSGRNITLALNSYASQYPGVVVPSIIGYYQNQDGSDLAMAFPSNGQMDVWKKTNFKLGADVTGSLRISGSTTFNGNAVFNQGLTSSAARINGDIVATGNISASGAITASSITATSASFQYVQTIYETSSIIFSSGSNQFGDAANDVQTLYGQVKVLNALTASGLIYPTTDGTLSGQVLQTDAAGTLSFGNVVGLYQTVHNGEATSLTVGTAVYVSGSQGANPIVYRADSTNTSKMPVQYIIPETIASGQNGRALLLGVLEGYNVGAAAAGTLFYVDGNGTLTSTRPTGSGDLVQPIAVVTKTGNGGQLSVLNPGPVLLPNLQTGYAWVGNGSNQPIAVATSSFATLINTASFATTGSNNFTGNQNIYADGAGMTLAKNAEGSGSAYSGMTIKVDNTTDPTNVFSAINFQDAQSGNGIGLGWNSYTPWYTSSIPMIFANAQYNGSSDVAIAFPNDKIDIWKPAQFNAPLSVSQSQVTLNNSGGLALQVTSGSVQINTPQGQGWFYSNLPITSSKLRINGTAIIKDLIVSGTWGGEGSGSLTVENNATISGSLLVSGSTIISSSLYVRGGDINHISNNTTVNPDLYLTESQAGQVNIIKGWGETPAVGGAGALQVNYTGSLRITGSNNTVAMPQIRASGIGGAADQQGYISGSDNVIAGNLAGIFLNTGSQLLPRTANNQLSINSTILMNFTTSSLSGGHPIVQNNFLQGANIVLNHPSGTVNAANNIITNGAISSSQGFVTNVRPAMAGNILSGGTSTLRHISSSITYGSNITSCNITVENHVSSSGLSNNQIAVTNNAILGGSSNTGHGIYTSGSQNSNVIRSVIDNIIGGKNIIVSSSFVSSSNSSLVASLVYGQNLIVSGNHSTTIGGSTFVGRYNDTGSGLANAQDIVFAVGTGTSTSARKTGLWIDSGSLTTINGGLYVSQSQVTLTNSGSVPGTLALAIRSGSVEVTSPQGNGYFYTNLPITSSNLRINGPGIIADLFVSGVFSGNSTLNVAGNSYFTGSVFTSASVNGVVTTVTTSSNTASLDFSKGNSFTVQLVSGSNTHIFPTNVQTGQTVNVKVNTVAGAGVTFQSIVKQVSGSGYVPTPATGVDILTMVTFDTTSDVYLANVKNLI